MRRGSVMFVVIWALAIAAVVLGSLQLFGYRQAVMGRQALARTQARWAARAGLEWAIAIMADHTTDPVPGDAFAMVRELDGYYAGELEADGRPAATWDVRYDADGRQWRGPMDEHSKLNINSTVSNPSLLQNIRGMTPDVVDAILDWIDTDDDERPIGAERNYYLGLAIPYEPRNRPMRSISELELVGGVFPDHLRGEDWNLNNRLDSNEDDGDRSWPPDEPDERLDAGYSALFTAYSRDRGLTGSGLPRIDLTQTDPDTLVERLGLEQTQATALIAWATAGTNTMEKLLTAQVQQMNRGRGGPPVNTTGGNGTTTPSTAAGAAADAGLVLTNDQLGLVLDETMIGQLLPEAPGRINLNTASEQLLLQILPDREHLVDEILYLRSSRPQGITSMVDLIEIPAFQDDTASLEMIASIGTVRSSVYSLTIRGHSVTNDLDVEIFAVVDRSSVPVRIMEYRE